MTDRKHTPGPWVLINHDEAGLHYVKAQPHPAMRGFTKEIADVFSGDEEGAANAALIASAPDLLAERDRLREVNAELLAALEAFAAIHDNSPDNTPWGCGLTNGHFFRAKEAIAKAKGGAA
ncbi:hypothetical protein [Ferrovibrio sp.]|uniref:hypothetical protein n=1 Tax=Ferrovibrio sp. TaxID=1917215 RepID=UPI0035AE29E2